MEKENNGKKLVGPGTDNKPVRPAGKPVKVLKPLAPPPPPTLAELASDLVNARKDTELYKAKNTELRSKVKAFEISTGTLRALVGLGIQKENDLIAVLAAARDTINGVQSVLNLAHDTITGAVTRESTRVKMYMPK